MTAVEFLFSLEHLGMKFGLENMRTLCAALDHPERTFRSIIVAGTNGKGSVTAMASAALHAAGYRSARYTSPHLERIEERFTIGERDVESADLERAASTVRDLVDGLVRAGTLETYPTFFECTTLVAFELFRRAAVDVAVIEVGLGGRLDATNVITPMAAAITSIDFDHQALLGNSLAAIAREKAGVIKKGIPVVVGPMPGEALAAIEDACRAQDARLQIVSDPTVAPNELNLADTGTPVVTLEGHGRRLPDVTLALRGRHQAVNAAIAMALLDAVADTGLLGPRIPDEAMRAGLERARWPGRLEIVEWSGAQVLIDAAHNPAGAAALAAYLRDAGWHGATLVTGVMRDKDASNIIGPLLPYMKRVICTTPPSPRAMPAADLAAIVEALATPGAVDVEAIADPEAAIVAASQGSNRIVAAGSIFLIGPLRGILR